MTLEKYIEHKINMECKNKSKIIIFPYGKYGRVTKLVLNEIMQINEYYIVDNYFSGG